jgi:hypothetical protein
MAQRLPYTPQEDETMRTKTNCKAGQETPDPSGGPRLAANHSETLVRDHGKNLKVKTALRAGTPSIPIPPPSGRR